jgi:hypothetical protein
MKRTIISIALAVCTLLCIAGCRKEITVPVEELTKEGYFTLRESNVTGKYGPVIIFPERHNSRLIQAEFAWAMDILLERCGINTIALEGMYIGETLDSKKIKYRSKEEKYDVLLALLERGEIKSPEFMYLARDSFVFGTEDKDEYAVTPPGNKAWDAFENYLAGSIIIDHGEDLFFQSRALYDAREIDFEMLLSINPWTLETYEIIITGRSIISINQRLNELENKTAHLFDVQTKTAFKDFKKFYEIAYQRSLTMAGHVYDRLQKKNQAMSMIIGAAHTVEITEYFDKNKICYYVLEPSSLDAIDIWSDLTSAEYKQKGAQKTVFVNEQIGAFFENTWNSRPRVFSPSFLNVNSLYQLIARMTPFASSGPPPKTPKPDSLVSNGMRTIWESVEWIGTDDIMFPIENRKGERIYARVVKNNQSFQSGNQRMGSIKKALSVIIKRLSEIEEAHMPFEQRVRAIAGEIEVFNVKDYTVFISPSSDTLREITDIINRY